MFDQLTSRLGNTFSRLRGRGLLTEADVDTALRDVRVALLEADVALPVVKRFMALVREQAVGENVLKAVKPGEQVVKLVHDALIQVLGEAAPLNFNTQPPAVIVMAGLQGSGKTTTTGKLAKYLKEKERKKVLLASLDVYRPAAQQQLQTLAERTGVASLPIIDGQKPADITKRALSEARKGGYDVLFLDTAGRSDINDDLMAELEEIKKLANPAETLLVADSLTGQVAVQVAERFHSQIGVSGIILTRMDGDGRGGAALSMREMTGQPIKFIGTGEGLDALAPFRPESVASRILGMGDVVELVEKAQAAMDEDNMADMQAKMFSGEGLNLLDLKKQLKMMQRMGGLGSIMGLLPGMGKLKEALGSGRVNEKMVVYQIAIIDSMTPQERTQPNILNARRRARIAAGAGVSVNDVNKLVKNLQQMNKMMKKFSGMSDSGKKNLLQGVFNGMK